MARDYYKVLNYGLGDRININGYVGNYPMTLVPLYQSIDIEWDRSGYFDE